MTTTKLTIRESELDGPATFRTPPAQQGQIVQASYAGLYDGRVLRRVLDRSDGTESYAVADLSSAELAREGEQPGVNHAPSIDGEWTPCTFVADVE